MILIAILIDYTIDTYSYLESLIVHGPLGSYRDTHSTTIVLIINNTHRITGGIIGITMGGPLVTPVGTPLGIPPGILPFICDPCIPSCL